jgi:hypothetical protein
MPTDGNGLGHNIKIITRLVSYISYTVSLPLSIPPARTHETVPTAGSENCGAGMLYPWKSTVQMRPARRVELVLTGHRDLRYIQSCSQR